MKTNNLLALLKNELLGSDADVNVVTEDGTTAAAKGYYEPSYTRYVGFFSPGTRFSSTGYNRDTAIKPSLSMVSNGTTRFLANNVTSTNFPKLGVIFGDGNTAPAATDYWLSGNMFTTFTAGVECTCQIVGNTIVCTGTYLLNNTAGTDFVIREIGLTRATDSSTIKYFLLIRDVLDTPITVPGNGQANVVYRLTLG